MRHRVLTNVDERVGEPSRSFPQVTVDWKQPVDLAKLIVDRSNRKEHFCSFELFPTGDEQTYQRFFSDTSECSPAFYALTWHGDTSAEPFPITMNGAESFPGNTLLHCAGKGLRRSDVEKLLLRALQLGIVNVFALQGERATGDAAGDFAHASDLVTFIRERFGDKFSICVAGYPEMHPDSPSKHLDLFYLKLKVDGGADFIITQFCFESGRFIDFVRDCRRSGIAVPIIPGIFPFTSAKALHRMSSICRVNIPPWMGESLRQIGDDDQAVRQFGVDLSVRIIREIRQSGVAYGYHVFTLNRSYSAIEIHRQLNERESIDN